MVTASWAGMTEQVLVELAQSAADNGPDDPRIEVVVDNGGKASSAKDWGSTSVAVAARG
jgi:hypothetical protein